MKKYIKIHSSLVGLGVGFLNFYFLFYSWGMSWEISFACAFALGYLASSALEIFTGIIDQDDFDIDEAKEISSAAAEFEEK